MIENQQYNFFKNDHFRQKNWVLSDLKVFKEL